MGEGALNWTGQQETELSLTGKLLLSSAFLVPPCKMGMGWILLSTHVSSNMHHTCGQSLRVLAKLRGFRA